MEQYQNQILQTSNIDALKLYFKEKLDKILYKQITVDNIEDFAAEALEKLILLNDEILEEYKSNASINPLLSSSIREQEDDAYQKFDLLDIQEILEQVSCVCEKIKIISSKLKLNIIPTNVVITPTISEAIPKGEGGIDRIFYPRLLTILYILEADFGIPIENTKMLEGIVTDQMFRQEPYYRVEIPDLGKVIYVCDEVGNVTYIFDIEKILLEGLSLEDVDLYDKNKKNELIVKHLGIGVRIIQSAKWRMIMSDFLRKDLIILPNQEGQFTIKSEFQVENKEKEWMQFSDFIEEIRKFYPGNLPRNNWYQEERKKHLNWPSAPHVCYSDDWTSWMDALPKEDRWPSFDDFKKEVIQYYDGSSSVVDWYHKERKKHLNWPSTPYKTYGDSGWTNWVDLVEKETFLDFEKFKSEIRSIYRGENPIVDWYVKLKINHPNWPRNPSQSYANSGWISFYDLVGRQNRIKDWPSFDDFKKEVIQYFDESSDVADWYARESRSHPNWPRNPSQTYIDSGWKSFPDLVGRQNRIKDWPSFDDFKKEVLQYYKGDNNVQEWYLSECQKHSNWPGDPRTVYWENGWLGYPELVDKENITKRKFLEFDDFVTDVKRFYPGSGSVQDWYNQEVKKHPNWPTNPHRNYKNKGWQGFGKLTK